MELVVENVIPIEVGNNVLVSFDDKEDMKGVVISLKHEESIINFGDIPFGEESTALYIDKISNKRIKLC